MEDTTQQLISTMAAAKLLGLSPSTLSKWRMKGTGPEYIKVGTRVLYERADIAAWLDANKRLHTNQMKLI
jgi:predicted DNA-binding transcriptional regulator AlpA